MSYKTRINGNGHRQIKNGAGQWTSPVIIDDKFFKSGAEASKDLGSGQSTITSAITRGKIGKRLIRRATNEDIVKALGKPSYPKKKIVAATDSLPLVYRVNEKTVEIKGPHGPWSVAILFDGSFYTNITTASKAENISRDNIYARIRDAGDVSVRYAVVEDLPKDSVRLHVKINRKETQEPFTGIRWPDGRVDVRLSMGGDILFTRQSDKDLPPEVRSRCLWL